MANLIPIITKELDLEIYEVFKIKGYFHNYRFTHTELQIKLKEEVINPTWSSAPPALLNILVYNSDLVIKLPFVPQRGDNYYTYTDCWIVSCNQWNGDAWDLMLQKAGCCFRSAKEAEKARPNIYYELTGREWKDG